MMMSDYNDIYALERQREEEEQLKQFREEMDESPYRKEQISILFGDMLTREKKTQKAPHTITNPDVKVTMGMGSSTADMYSLAETELLKMKSSGQIDTEKLGQILQSLLR